MELELGALVLVHGHRSLHLLSPSYSHQAWPGVKDVVFICVNLNEETLKRSETHKSGGKETDWD